ncbi:hypothetical protein [Lacticaseibacillus paracasei]|uniref:hypothetical protein n=1 Tax=Lacticaseibacillus paracasei TaxID=1597 RepID=UPI0031DC1B90
MELISTDFSIPVANHAGFKARIDAIQIAEDVGFKHVVINGTAGNNRVTRLAHSYLEIFHLKRKIQDADEGIVFAQYPFDANYFNRRFFLHAFARTKLLKVLLVHDLNSIRGLNKIKEQSEVDIFNQFDVVIAHTPEMVEFLRDAGVSAKLMTLKIFDYLIANQGQMEADEVPKKIFFAGNLKKSHFLDDLSMSQGIKLIAYGPAGPNQAFSENVDYQGVLPPDRIPSKLKKGWGLVWDGDSSQGLDNRLGSYLRIISPHKASLYLASGIPVIAPTNSAVGHFIQQNKVGITINNLSELDKKISKLNSEDWKLIEYNVGKWQSRLTEGLQLKSVLRDILEDLPNRQI